MLWHPAWFGAKPAYVLKAGLPAWAAVGDPNAAIDTAQPLVLGPQFAGSGAAPADVSVVFVTPPRRPRSGDAVPTRRRRVAVRGTRAVGLASMLGGNARTGDVRVDPGPGASPWTARCSRRTPPSTFRSPGSTTCDTVTAMR